MKTIYLLIAQILLGSLCFSLKAQEFGTFIDKRDGKVYKTVKIANQEWFADNLAFDPRKTYSGCSPYNDDKRNIDKYGLLYTEHEAKKVCPKGWHLPSKEEFDLLLKNCGNDKYVSYEQLIDGGNSGFSIKLAGSRNSSFQFVGMDLFTGFWTASRRDILSTWFLEVKLDEKSAELTTTAVRNIWLYIRCIKDITKEKK